MEWVVAIFFIPLMALLDALRGNAVYWWESKGAVSAYITLACLLAVGLPDAAWYWQAGYAAAIYLAWLGAFAPGIGDLNTAYNGVREFVRREEVFAWLGFLFEPHPRTPAQVRRWGTACAIGRSTLFAAPFCVMGFVDQLILFIAPFTALAGFIYPLQRYMKPVEIAERKLFAHYTWTTVRRVEVMRGAYFGLLLAAASLVG